LNSSFGQTGGVPREEKSDRLERLPAGAGIHAGGRVTLYLALKEVPS